MFSFFPSNKEVSQSPEYIKLLNYMQSKSEFYSGAGILEITIARFIIAQWLYTFMIGAPNTNRIYLFLTVADKTNQDAEMKSQNKVCKNLDQIINAFRYWTKECKNNLKEIIKKGAQITDVFNTELSTRIINLYASVDNPELMDFNGLRNYYIAESDSPYINGHEGNIKQLDACKYFLTRWLVERLENMNWNSQELSALLIAASNININLETAKDETPISSLLSILTAHDKIFLDCDNEFYKVKMIGDSYNTLLTPSVLITNDYWLFNTKSILSECITDLFNEMQRRRVSPIQQECFRCNTY